jgi:hypothetical protein
MKYGRVGTRTAEETSVARALPCAPIGVQHQIADDLASGRCGESVVLDDVTASKPTQHRDGFFAEAQRDEVRSLRRFARRRTGFPTDARLRRSLTWHVRDSAIGRCW